MKIFFKRLFLISLLIILSMITKEIPWGEAGLNDYCYVPPTVGQSVPPLVMLISERDHKLYYEAYNDASDLDGDGKLDVGYKHSIDYYGYFDPYKCYSYDGSKFIPIRQTNNKYCGGTNEWSGNFLNWLTMARIDVLRKVLYGGYRRTDSASETVLEATYIPQDAHSWGKEYNGSDTRSLTPFNPPSSGTRHLFCITSTSNDNTRKIRVLQNKSNRIWEWASKERPVCDNSLGTPSEYYISVKVCDPSVGLEPNCKRYPGGGGTYKPIGLLQKYGEGDGSKWCSKTLKPCQTNNDCGSNEGLCVFKGQMYFGLITGSYEKNMSGGVLRKNIWSIFDETNNQTGIFQTSENTPGNIVLTFDRLKIVDFRYSDYSYEPGWSGAWVTTRPMNEGEFKNWGNPIGEMLYEAIRYFAGKLSPTSDFTYSGNQDGGLNLPKPGWGKYTAGGSSYRLYDLFPICAKPFVIILSDINNSYDSDKVPGSSFGTFSGDISGLNVTTLADLISSQEGITNKPFFIGQSLSIYDTICSAKSVSSLATIRGLCPEEPTKQGSFYVASLAYYGNKAAGGWRDNFSGIKPPPIKTLSVALASPIPDIAVTVGGKLVRITPVGKSVSGCLNVYSSCAQKCTLTFSGGRLNITGCNSNAYCPTNQIVDFYVDRVDYDSNGNLIYAKFRINFEDVEQGADHDMDAIVEYEIQPIGSNQIKLTLNSTFAAGCLDQVLGFTISGTTEDDTWLVVKDKDAYTDGDTPAVVGNMPLTWQRTFSVTGSPAGQLKPPLWYAAKWGGFDDLNGNDIPDLPQEWDRDGDGNPDTYFYVVNPLRLESQLESAFLDILRRASSGATVAALTSRGVSGAVMVQPYYFPRFQTSLGEVSWIGSLRALWLDFKARIREDTNLNKILEVLGSFIDRWIIFGTASQSSAGPKVFRILDETTCSYETTSLYGIKPLFDAGCLLSQRNYADRKIYTNLNGNLFELTDSDSNLINQLASLWNPTTKELLGDSSVNINATTAKCILNYIRGSNATDCPGGNNTFIARSREVQLSNLCGSESQATWKLGDIVYSTPTVISHSPLNDYHLKYGDRSYLDYIRTNAYKKRNAYVFVGANDGMLHAFRLGWMIAPFEPPARPIKLVDAFNSNTADLIGKEEWAFIPKNALPYLAVYGMSDYCHIFTADYKVSIFDAKINGQWRTLLLGMMGFGARAVGNFSSSIFLLDLTDWLAGTSSQPELLWETTLPDKTLTISYPHVIKIRDGWYVVIGSGPVYIRGAGDGVEVKYPATPKLYFFNLSNGNLEREIPLSRSNEAVGDIRPIDYDNDYNDDLIYFGTYNSRNQRGLLFRLSFKDSNGTYKSIASLSNSDIKVALLDFPERPIFAAPELTLDESKNIWVLFGTGTYFGDDRNLTKPNYFVGFKDVCAFSTNATCTSWSSLVDRTSYCSVRENYNATVLYNSTETTCEYNSITNRVEPVNTGLVYAFQFDKVSSGWYHVLATNERMYSQPLIYASLVNALSFITSSDPCTIGGTTNYWMVCYKEGCPCLSARGEEQPQAKRFFAPGAPAIGQPFQVMETMAGIVLFTQTSEQPPSSPVHPLRPPGLKGAFVFWIEK